MSTEQQLETFRKAYPSVRVNVMDGCLVYSFGGVMGGLKACRGANELIKTLELPLVATWSPAFPEVMNVKPA